MLLLNAVHGRLEAEVPAEEWDLRENATPGHHEGGQFRRRLTDLAGNQFGMGRELFTGFRQLTDTAERGCFTFNFDD
jgi:phosphogluconate dehydratase